MKSLNPAAKFLALLLPTFVLAARPNPMVNLAVFVLCVGAILCSGRSLRSVCAFFGPILLAAFGMFMTGYRFSSSGGMPVNAQALHIGSSAVYNGLLLAGRVLAFAGLGLLFALTTDKIEMVQSFRRQFHLPPVFAYGLLAAWGIFPHMAQEYRRTRVAFRARGLHVLPFSPALLCPLLVKSVRWSEELAVAMESKGFSGSNPRTEYEPPALHRRDIAFFLLLLVLLGMLYWLMYFFTIPS